jgi:flavin reductase (DIM6/NTAB) family NADH-FMN oxidoreductase RutF
MQQDIGPVMGLYPTPVTICGVVLEDGRVNWLPIAHVGVAEHHRLMVSIDRNHELSDAAIAKNQALSVSLVDERMMVAADYCGMVKAADVDKSDVFPYHFDDVAGAPVLEEAPLCMTCRVVDMLEVGAFHDYILEPVHTYVQNEYVTASGKVDYAAMSPVLFEFSSAQYLGCGDVIGKCWSVGEAYER